MIDNPSIPDPEGDIKNDIEKAKTEEEKDEDEDVKEQLRNVNG